MADRELDSRFQRLWWDFFPSSPRRADIETAPLALNIKALLTADSDKITATPERYGFQARDGTTVASKVTAAQSPTQEAFAHKAQKHRWPSQLKYPNWLDAEKATWAARGGVSV